MCILLKRKHAEAKELAVRAIVNNNMILMLNHPMFEEKISSLHFLYNFNFAFMDVKLVFPSPHEHLLNSEICEQPEIQVLI